MYATELSQSEVKINQNDPKQLKGIINDLIEKSKILIVNLQQTLGKVEKAEMQRDYWKQNYFNFKESCERYIESRGIEPFEYMSALQSRVKKLTIQNECLNETLKRRLRLNQRKQQQALSCNKKIESNKKSVSTIHNSRFSPASKAMAGNKRIQLFRSQKSKSDLRLSRS